jgi:hypothetical protein
MGEHGERPPGGEAPPPPPPHPPPHPSPLPPAQRRAARSPLEYAGPRSDPVVPRGGGDDEDRGAFFVVRMVVGTLAWLALAYCVYAMTSEW